MDAESGVTDLDTTSNQGTEQDGIVDNQPGEVTEGQQAEATPQAYTDEEFIQIAESGKGLDITRLTPAQRASHSILEKGVTKRLAEVNATEMALRQRANEIEQMRQLTAQTMQKAMQAAPVDEQLYFQYVQNPNGTTMEIENAARNMYLKSIDDSLPIEDRKAAAEAHFTLNKALTNVQNRFQNDQRQQGYSAQIQVLADQEIAKIIPDIQEKGPKIDAFVQEQGIDMRLASAIMNPMILENICRVAGINLNGAQAKAQVVKLINSLYDKTAGVIGKTKTAAPAKPLSSKTATPAAASKGDAIDPYDPKMSTEDRIAYWKKQKAG